MTEHARGRDGDGQWRRCDLCTPHAKCRWATGSRSWVCSFCGAHWRPEDGTPYESPEDLTVDLWEVVRCGYCGAAAGDECETAAGRVLSRSHAARHAIIPADFGRA